MFSGQHFYHRGIRKNVVIFGNLFNDILLVRYEKNTYVETERFRVPLIYAGKENFVSRLYRDPDIIKEIQVKLPRMSFEMIDIQYDVNRKMSSFNNQFQKIGGTSVKTLAQGTPYDITFELNIYTRNVEDGTQIVEQILPYFNPDYTMSVNFIEGMDVKRDVPVILNSINYQPSYEGDGDTARMLIWTLRFTMKTWFFGNVSDGKIIRKSTANVFMLTNSNLEYQTLALANTSNNTFKLGEIVYQGTSYSESTARGTVYDYDRINNILILKNLTNEFGINVKVVGAETGATAIPVTEYNTPQQLVNITVVPDPINADIEDDYGFTTTIEEFPNIT